MYGLVDIQRSLNDSASAGFAKAAQIERERDMADKQLRAADSAAMKSSVGTGAGIGAMAASGTAVGGPLGALIGAGVGYLTYKFL